MTFYLALRARILDLDGVAGAYRTILPSRPDLPAVVLQQIPATQRVGTHDGGPATAHVEVWQLDVYAETIETLEDVTEAVAAALDGWVDKTEGLDRAFVTDRRDDYEPEARRLKSSLDLSAHVRSTADVP